MLQNKELPNLNALRFFAFFSVMLLHCWQVNNSLFQLTPFLIEFRYRFQFLKLGVNFFFVLSGFLITKNILTDINEKKFSVLNFYKRRALRIWPLYFLILLIVYVIVPLVFHVFGKVSMENSNPWYWIFFAANFYIINIADPYSPPLIMLWSVAVEEQFYLVWPWLIKAGKKFLPVLFVIIVIISLCFRGLHLNRDKTIYFHTLSVMSDFAFGAMLAWIFIFKQLWFNKIFAWPLTIKVALLFGMILLLVFRIELMSFQIYYLFDRVVLATFFFWITAELALNKNSIFNPGKINAFNYLGKISYGLYCYHSFALVILNQIYSQFKSYQYPFSFLVVLPLSVLILTVIISSLSYRYFELPFLKLKNSV